MGLTDGFGGWFLVNASVDLPAQLRQFSDIQPRSQPVRNSPIIGVLVTNADLDHVLGIFSLREGNTLDIHATKSVRQTAARSLGLENVLNAFCGVRWHEPPTGDFGPLPGEAGRRSNLLYRVIALGGNPPPFAADCADSGTHSVAYQFLDERTGGRLLVAPDVGIVNQELKQTLESSQAVLFDGTFWSVEELSSVKPGARKASDMGHVTIKDCSLELLGGLAAKRKIYIHINNTNPILARDSLERAAVERAGIIVGEDGLEFSV